jgi:hypothetical protein
MPAGIAEFLDGLDWSGVPAAAARGAAVGFSFAVTGDVGPEWFERLFDWLDLEADPATGLWRRGVEAASRDRVDAAFPYAALYDRFHRPLPAPERAFETALALQGASGLFDPEGPGGTDLASAYVIDRAARQSPSSCARAPLTRLLAAAAERVADAGFRERALSDPGRTAEVVSLLALLSRALPGAVRSRRPLRFHLDRHFFV